MDAPLKVKKPSIVFLGSMCDLFCEAALRFYETNGHGMRWPYFLNGSPHQFVVLTKQPGNIPRGWNDDVPNLWVGVSVTREHEQPDYKRAMTLLDRIQERRILCIEPMLGPPVVIYPLTEFPWIILGGLTGARYPHAWGAPGLDAVEKIVDEAERADVPVFLKKNLSPRIPLSYVMAHREYPPELAAVKGEKA
jgi:protein gp37